MGEPDQAADLKERAKKTKGKPGQRIRWRAEYVVFRLIVRLLGMLPYRTSVFLGRVLGRLSYFVLQERRKITLSNIERVFSDTLVPAQRGRIAVESFENLGMLLADFARFPRFTPTTLRGIVDIVGIENLREAMELGRGVLCLGAHYGSFELMSYSLALLGNPLTFVIRQLDNPFLDVFVRTYRELSGNRTIPKQNAIREMLRELKKGRVVGILIDQHAFPDGAVYVEVMGVKAWTSTSLATIALRTQAPVVPVMIERKKDLSGHILLIEPPVSLIHTGHRKEEIELNTKLFNQILHRWVLKRPELWLWCHRRWRD